MDNELQTVAKEYIGLLTGAIALRAKAAPTKRFEYDPLTMAMTQLALCLRKKDTTERELIIAIRSASSVWSEWQEQHCHFWERLAKSELEELERGDLLAEIGVVIVREKPYATKS